MVLPFTLEPVLSIHTGRERLTPFNKRYIVYKAVSKFYFGSNVKVSRKKDADL